MTAKDLHSELRPIFHPRAVALIGASSGHGKVGRIFMERFLEAGFERLYPVNPREGEILGVETHPSVRDIPEPVDLALILAPPKAVKSAVKECAECGVKGIAIITGSVGDGGAEEVREIVKIARAAGSRLIGPNCLGIYCPAARLPYPMRPSMESGSVGVVSQSGSFADLLTLMACENGVRFSKAVSCGNESDLNAVDFLEYLGEDPDTEIIVAYLEGIEDGRRFYRLARDLSRSKPLVIWKCGATAAGSRAAASHTGALSGSREIWSAVLRGAGILAVRSLEETLDCLYALYYQPLPKGRRVAIATGPGGPAVGTVDACVELGLELPRLSSETRRKLAEIIPASGTSVENPVDLSIAAIVAPHLYAEVVGLLDRDENLDMLLIIGTGGEGFAEAVRDAARAVSKPVVVSLINPVASLLRDYEILMGSGVPVYPDPMRAAVALAKLAEYAAIRGILGPGR
jgi:acetyltransferase